MGRLVKTEVKYIQSLRQRSRRSEAGAFVAEGDKLILEILHNHAGELKTLYCTPEFAFPDNDVLKNVDLRIIDSADLERLSSMRQPQNALAVVKLPVSEYVSPPMNAWSLMLDNIQDPGNLGSIIRAADWFGVQHIYCSEQTADAYNSKVVQATMGSIFRVNMHYGNLEKILLHTDLPLLVADAGGESLSTSFKFTAGGILVIGSEGQGVSASIKSRATHIISIPRIGGAESLNAAMATGILLSHLVTP